MKLSQFPRRVVRGLLGKLRASWGLNGPDVAIAENVRLGLFNAATGEVMRGFAIDESDTVVDVGCGDGGTTLFAARLGAEVIGVDVLEDKIAQLRQKLANLAEVNALDPLVANQSPPPRLPRAFQAIVSDANPLPLPDGCATKVICQEVLEHVDDPAQFMSELVRIGKPGARYLLTVPDPILEHANQKIAEPIYWERPNHLRIFERDQFARLVIDAGLRIEKRILFGFYWSMWWTLFWGYSKPLTTTGGYGAPMLDHWNLAWAALLQEPKGAAIAAALDQLLPKSQVIVAVK
jgi:SAM-dependent methyltransferase